MGEHRARHEEDEQRVEEDVAVEGGEAPVTDEERGGHGGGGEAPRERPDCQEAEGDDADPKQGAEHAHPVHLGDMINSNSCFYTNRLPGGLHTSCPAD